MTAMAATLTTRPVMVASVIARVTSLAVSSTRIGGIANPEIGHLRPRARSGRRSGAPARRRSRPRSSRSSGQAAARAAKADSPRLAARTGREQRGEAGNHQPGQSRRHEVHHVVEPRAAPAEAQVARRLVADHRVHRAHDLEQHEPGQPASTYQNTGLTKPSVRFSLRLSTAARRQAPASIRSVSRPTSALTAARAPRQVAARGPPTRSARRGAADRRAPAGCRARKT